MERIEHKKKDSLTGILLRLFKANRGFQESVGLQKGDAHVGIPRSSYHDYQKEIKTALLEAERKKAEAIERQRRNFIC